MYEKARTKALSSSKRLLDLHHQRAAGGDVSHMHIAVAAEAVKNAHEKAMIHATKPEDVNMHEKHADKATHISNLAHAASLKEAFHPEASKSMNNFRADDINKAALTVAHQQTRATKLTAAANAHTASGGGGKIFNERGSKLHAVAQRAHMAIASNSTKGSPEHKAASQAIGEHAVASSSHYYAAQKSLSQQGEVMDFNDFFKSEDTCNECGQHIEKSHGPVKGSVAEDNKKSPKKAGTGGHGAVPITRAHGGNAHKKNETEKSDEQPTLRKSFQVSDTFKAVEYVNENGELFSDIGQFAR